MNNLMDLINNPICIGQCNGWLFVMAFLGGIVSSLSPCALGLLPVIIGYVGGQEHKKDAKLMIQVLSFILGISITLTIIGISCALTGQVLGASANPYVILFLASLILVMGLQMLGILYIPIPQLVKSLPQNNSGSVFIIPALIGAAFALGTTPCSTPILASIMAFASIKSNLWAGALLFFLFSLGQGVILFIAAFFTNLCRKFLALGGLSSFMMKISGLVLIFASLYLFYRIFLPFF